MSPVVAALGVILTAFVVSVMHVVDEAMIEAAPRDPRTAPYASRVRWEFRLQRAIALVLGVTITLLAARWAP